MRKKLFTFLLALATSVGMMWAQGPWTSGDCTVTLSGGVMTVSGNGAMADYYKTTPWDSYKSSITSIVIEDGVTHVGNETFCVCDNLVSVTIGNDVVTIGSYAFDDCYKFTTLTLGNSIQSIGECAFMWSTELTELNLPASLQSIGNNAFLQCKKITTVTIPSKVTSIGESAFYNCIALTSITTEATTPPTLGATVFDKVPTSIPLYVPNGSVAAYTAAAQWNAFNIQGYDPAPTPANVCGDGLTWELSEGVLTISYDGEGTGEMYDFGYEYDENPVNVAPWKENKSAITTVIVGDGVKSIGNHAFNDLSENFTAVTIANSVEHIGLNAFLNSEEITEITLPSSLKTIDEQGFANCGFTSITIPSGVTSIGYKAFCYCRDLTSLTCEATTPPTLASSVFYKIRSSTSSLSSIPLYVPSGSVTAYEAAAQWNAFNVQAIPGGGSTPANSCGDGVIWELNNGALTISYTGTGTGVMDNYDSASDAPWYSSKNDITSVTITDGVKSVGSYSFGYYGNLVTVTIGNDVETIGYYAFGDCYKFTTLNLGNSVKHIGDRAFMWAKVLTGFTLPSTLETIGERAFLQNKVITSLTIPSNVTSIGQSAFYYCAALTSITVEATTPPTLGETVFDGVPTSIPLYVPNGSVATYTAAAQWNAFDIQGYDPAPTPTNVCGNGLTWELSDGVLTISYDGEGTGEMNDFDYEYDDSPVNVAPWKENKSDITTVVIGDGVKSIGNHAFNDLSENFTAVTIANSVERIGVSAFMNSKEITEMTLPSSLKTIDKEGLANCGFATITIPSGVTSIGVRAFCYCSNLTSLTCEATTPPTLGTGVFSGIKNKQNIPLYVPSESVAAYQDADQWKAFNVQAIPAPQPELAECGLTWTGVPEGGVVGTIGHEDEIKLPQVNASQDFILAYKAGTVSLRLGSTDKSVLAVYGFNNFAVNGVGECDVYVVHDEDAVFAYDSAAFHVTVNPEQTVWTALKVGDVIKVGDKIEVPNEGDGSWGINGNVLRNAWGPYTLIRADIYQASDFDDPVVTETEDGAFYVFKAENSDFYPLSYLGKSGGLVVTATSDGLVVTAAENKEFTVAVHENGSIPTAVENVQTNHVQGTKILRDGMLLIIRDGKTYNVVGTVVR